jgi:arylsulfatase A-like enzyme
MLRRDTISGLTVIIIVFFLLGTANTASEKEEDVLESDSTLFAAEIKDGFSNEVLSRSGIEQLTNRRKVLAKDADLESVANEDVASPNDETRLVIMAADLSGQKVEDGYESTEHPEAEATDLSQTEAGANPTSECEPVIGLSYKDSVPCWPESPQPPKGAPNVIFIVLDDVGFGQLGCFGGPIDTPNIDRLAAGGLRYNNFHTTALCSPTRACLLTGRNHHSVGVASITELATGFPGYNMHIPKDTATLAEMLKEEGYSTIAVGKWHLAPSSEIGAFGPYDEWPLGRGFERYYGFLGSHNSEWYPDLVYDNHRIDPPATPEEGYHLSEDLADRAMQFVMEQQTVNPDKPYFLYLAFGACHHPHHAPKEFIEEYEGEFDQGWDVVREETLARQKSMGIVPADTELPPRPEYIEAWDNLSADEKVLYARMQEVFAGYLTHADLQIGRVIDFLNETGELNNTLIVLLSDNGATPEGDANGYTNAYLQWGAALSEGGGVTPFFSLLRPSGLGIEYMLTKIDELGGPTSYPVYPMGWAMAGNTPFKLYKWTTHEGGVRDPLIVYWPEGINDAGDVRSQFCHVIDIVPTVLEAVGVEVPEVCNNLPQKPIEGISIEYTFNDPDAPTRKKVQYFEMVGCRAIWYDGWKAVAYHPLESGGDFEDDVWELYNLSEDVSETHNLAAEYPDKLQEMQERWWAEAGRYNVLPLDDRYLERGVSKPITGTFTYYPNFSTIHEPDIPDTLNSSYTITAFVDTPTSGAEGALFSIGGTLNGLSFYVQDKHLVYDYNFVGIKHDIITSQTEVPIGPSTLSFAFNKTGDHQGTGSLFINGEKVGEGQIAHTIVGRYSFEEGLEVGRDSKTPVSESYESPFRFDGTLEKVVLEVEG